MGWSTIVLCFCITVKNSDSENSLYINILYVYTVYIYTVCIERAIISILHSIFRNYNIVMGGKKVFGRPHAFVMHCEYKFLLVQSAAAGGAAHCTCTDWSVWV